MDDLISRQAAIDIERNATVDTNPSHFEAHQKFKQFMDDAEISSFGRWQWSNGFNTALTAVGIDLKKLPSAQPKLEQNTPPEHGESDKLGLKMGGTCTDTISRQEAIEYFVTNVGFHDEDGYSIDDSDKLRKIWTEYFNGIPSAQPYTEEQIQKMQDVEQAQLEEAYRLGRESAQRWIPCSERLPEKCKEVLVCYDFKGHRSVLIGTLYGDESFHGYDDEYLTSEGRRYRKAVAWMLLPEPYKERREE